MVTGVLVVNIHKAAPNVHRAVAGGLSLTQKDMDSMIQHLQH